MQYPYAPDQLTKLARLEIVIPLCRELHRTLGQHQPHIFHDAFLTLIPRAVFGSIVM